MNGPVSFCSNGELSLFDAVVRDMKLGAPNGHAKSVRRVEAVRDLVTYDSNDKLLLFDAARSGKELDDPTEESSVCSAQKP